MFPIQSASSGRRAGARRPLAFIALLTSLTLTLAASPSDKPQVDVREERGVYHVTATFRIPQPAAIAMAVLTDYERIPKFMPDVRTSRVVERREKQVVVEQEAVARFLMFSKQVHLLLDIEEQPALLAFRDRCGKSFSTYDGSWTLEERTDGTSITYRLTAKPTFDVPGFLLKRLLKRDSAEMIGRIQAEIARRAK